MENLDRSLHDRGFADPSRRARCTLGPTAQARSITSTLRREVICEKLDVLALRLCWANRPTVNSRRANSDKKLAVKSRIPGSHGFVEHIFALHSAKIARTQAKVWLFSDIVGMPVCLGETGFTLADNKLSGPQDIPYFVAGFPCCEGISLKYSQMIWVALGSLDFASKENPDHLWPSP